MLQKSFKFVIALHCGSRNVEFLCFFFCQNWFSNWSKWELCQLKEKVIGARGKLQRVISSWISPPEKIHQWSNCPKQLKFQTDIQMSKVGCRMGIHFFSLRIAAVCFSFSQDRCFPIDSFNFDPRQGNSLGDNSSEMVVGKATIKFTENRGLYTRIFVCLLAAV